MFSQLSSFFSGLKTGKSKKPKPPRWYNDDDERYARNGSAEYDDYDDVNPSYFGCLGRSGGSSSDSNGRQRRNGRAASTQSLDKLGGRQKGAKALGGIKGAASMLDLNAAGKKKSKKSDRDRFPDSDLDARPIGNSTGSGSGSAPKAGIGKSHRLGFGKFTTGRDEEREKKKKKDKREEEEQKKNDRLKRGASWRHAYRQGSIILEGISGAGLPRVNTEERFVIDKSSHSSSNSSQNASNETRQGRFNPAPNQYSSTIQLAGFPQFDSAVDGGNGNAVSSSSLAGSGLNINFPARKDDRPFGLRGKENRAQDSNPQRRASVQRTDDSLSARSPAETPTATTASPSSGASSSSSAVRAIEKAMPRMTPVAGSAPTFPSHYLGPPPPPPPPTQPPAVASASNHQQQKIDDVDGTPFSAILRKMSIPESCNIPSSSGQRGQVGGGANHSRLSRGAKSGLVGGSCVDIAAGTQPSVLEKHQSKVTFNEEKNRAAGGWEGSDRPKRNPACRRKGSLKVEDLVQQMSLSDLAKFSPGGALSTPLPAHRRPPQQQQPQQQPDAGDHADSARPRRQKENSRTPLASAQTPGRTPLKSSPSPVVSSGSHHHNNNNNNPSSNPGHVPAKSRKIDFASRKLELADGDVRVLDPKTGTTYAKGKLLGKGGFARCYEMKDLRNGAVFAGKIMSKQNLAKKNQMEKIIREIELHFCLSHRNVVRFYNFFEDSQYVYIMLELCSRKSLVHVLKQRKTLTEPEVRYYMRRLTDGVRYIHGQGIIHRDLKLGNMLLDARMELKIADFGLATRVEYEGERKTSVCGTPNYIAPEVLQKAGYSYEADIWAMGCIMYAMLCGRPPFESSTLKETYTRIATNRYASPQHVSSAARSLIKHLLTSESHLRPSLDRIAADNFFRDGYLPEELSPSTCETRPKFPLAAITVNNDANRNKSGKVRSGQQQQQSTANENLGSMAQSKNSRKSASQIITRPKASEFESAASSNTKEEFSVGSAPSIPRNLNSSLKGSNAQQISASRLLEALNHQLELLEEKKGEPIPSGAVGVQPGSGGGGRWSRAGGAFVTKWVDYSNKYGFGYLLSNGSVGILFLDGTKILLGANSTVQVETPSGDKSSYSTRAVPPCFQQKTMILVRFMQFMEAHLVAGGDVQASPGGSSALLRGWFRTERAIVMHLTDGTVQVNFIWDHVKVVLSFEEGQQDSVHLTVIDTNRQASTYPLKALASLGCTSDMLERLRYVSKMIETVSCEDK